MKPGKSDKIILLFDGVCNACNASVNFVLRHDRNDRFRFCALQSASGKALLNQHGKDPEALDTLVLIEGEKVYLRSSAALRILRHLPGMWPLLYGFIAVPPFLRDAVYKLIARNRYKWFGKRTACRVPDAATRLKFIGD